MALDEMPLPDEDFDWTGIPEEIRPAVQAILEQCDGCADALFDVEHRTAMRRFLARAARNDPKVFARKGSPVRGAAAVAWVITTGNRTAGVWSADDDDQGPARPLRDHRVGLRPRGHPDAGRRRTHRSCDELHRARRSGTARVGPAQEPDAVP